MERVSFERLLLSLLSCVWLLLSRLPRVRLRGLAVHPPLTCKLDDARMCAHGIGGMSIEAAREKIPENFSNQKNKGQLAVYGARDA